MAITFSKSALKGRLNVSAPLVLGYRMPFAPSIVLPDCFGIKYPLKAPLHCYTNDRNTVARDKTADDICTVLSDNGD